MSGVKSKGWCNKSDEQRNEPEVQMNEQSSVRTHLPPHHLVQLIEQNLRKEQPASYFLSELCIQRHAMKAQWRILFGGPLTSGCFHLAETRGEGEDEANLRAKQGSKKKGLCNILKPVLAG